MKARLQRPAVSGLCLIVGVILLIAGFVAAFTYAGAPLIWAGVGSLFAGIALRTRLHGGVIAVIAVLVVAGFSTYTLLVYP